MTGDPGSEGIYYPFEFMGTQTVIGRDFGGIGGDGFGIGTDRGL